MLLTAASAAVSYVASKGALKQSSTRWLLYEFLCWFLFFLASSSRARHASAKITCVCRVY